MDEKRLKEALKALWNNDNDVPASNTSRCVELNWFSCGVKDNVVAYIAIEVFGLEEAKKILGEPDLAEDFTF